MARRILTWKTLNKTYSGLSQQFKDTIEFTVKKILKKEKGVQIRFKESVYVTLTTDNNYADCRGIQLGDDGSLTFQIESHNGFDVNEFDSTIGELDLSACYEVLLALNEKNFVVENQL